MSALFGGAACGPSPATSAAPEVPSGTLVVVIRQGPERVPFEPKVARMQRANQQLSEILGHSIQIELDGALLPQTHDGAEDVIARLVEEVARDLDALRREDKRALELARARFERLVVRYAPSEAAARDDRWRRRSGAKLDLASKTIDVVRAEAGWQALDRGEIAGVLRRAFAAESAARYAHVLPDALPPAERRSWFDYHARGGGSGAVASKDAPSAKVGSVDALRVRGMVLLHGLATRANDAALSKDVRAWLVNATSDFSSAYHHHATEVESASATSAYRQAESAYVSWVRTELPRMTLDERGKIAAHLFVIDFRKDHGARDRFATYAFPDLDPMPFSFDAVDAWIAAGHPTTSGSGDAPSLFDAIVCPVRVENRNGQQRFSHSGRCEGTFYRWALANRAREDSLVRGTIARGDVPFATALFYNARRALREETDYLRFLRRFEEAPSLWKLGADVHREVTYRPSSALLEEARRLWREKPAARGHALFWFARHVDASYHPETDWPDLVQGTLADESSLGAFLDLGWEAFELLPAAWPGLAKSAARIRLVTTRSKPLLAAELRGRGVAGTLTAIARILCDERSMGELAELRAFAQSELAASPGAGLSDVVEASDPARCAPKPRAMPPKPSPKKMAPRARASHDPLVPVKPPLDENGQ